MRPFTGKNGFTKSSPGIQTNLHEISAYDFLLANMNALKFSDDVKVDTDDKPVDPLPEDDTPDTRLINAPKSKGKLVLPGDISCVMSNSSTRHAKLAQTPYHAPLHDSIIVKNLLLIDRGAMLQEL
jgi:hypothetical protein